MTTSKKPPTPFKGSISAEDLAKAITESLAMPQEEFDRKLEEFEQERDRKAKEALKALRKKRESR